MDENDVDVPCYNISSQRRSKFQVNRRENFLAPIIDRKVSASWENEKYIAREEFQAFKDTRTQLEAVKRYRRTNAR